MIDYLFKFHLFIVLCGTFCLSSCLEDDGLGNDVEMEKPEVEVTDTVYFTIEGIKVSNGIIDEIGYDYANIKADFSSFNASTFSIVDYGHVVSKSSTNPTINNNDGSSSLGERTGVGQFSSEILNLEPDTEYFARVYVKKDNGEYGYHENTISFRTLIPEPPSVVILGTENITPFEITVNGKIVDFKSLNVQRHGFVWSAQNSSPTIEDNQGFIDLGTLDESSSYSYTYNLSSLSPGTTYFIRAFAQNEQGVSYWNEGDDSVISRMTLPSPEPILELVSTEIISDTNGDGNANSGEELAIEFEILNSGNKNAENISFLLSGNNFNVVSSLPIYIGDIVAGSSGKQVANIKLDNNIPWGANITMSIILKDDSNNEWSAQGIFEVVSPYVVPNGLVFYNRFEECSGDFTEDQISGTTGDLFQNASFSNDVPFGGNFNNCSLDIEPSDAYVHFPVNPFYDVSSLTISYWIKTTSSNYYIILAGNQNSASSMRLRVYDNEFQGIVTSAGLSGFDLTNYHDNQWHHFVITVEKDVGSKLYIDGNLKNNHNSYTMTGTTTGQVFRLFYNPLSGSGNDSPFANFDNFRVYNRAISPTEVSTIFNSVQ